MASSDLRAELDCSICLNIYTDPVMLKCGHNFCRACIDRVLDTQGESGVYFCPQCRDEFQERPALHKNITLRNISQQFLSAQPEHESEIFCTYCIHACVPAVRSCLLCEASLCDNHLNVHSKSPEHVLCDPTASLENRKCSVHKKILEYYCTEDSAYICESCRSSAVHRGHQVDALQEALTNKKKKLAHNLQKLIHKKEETERRVRGLRERRGNLHGKANGEAERMAALFTDLRKRLDDLEKTILREISRQEEELLRPVNDLIQQLEIKKDELSRKIHRMEELCNMKDPLTVLQESDMGDTKDGDDEEERRRHDHLLYNGGDLHVSGISHTFRSGLSDLLTAVIGGICIHKAEDVLLDEDTAHEDLAISDDRRTVSRTGTLQYYSYSQGRFEDYNQVLGSRSFSSGRHYWEVDVRKSNNWRIGMCYDSIDREGDDSLIGSNDVSWAMDRKGKKYLVAHDGYETNLDDNLPCDRVRVYLDYEAGQISFYICDPIEHLHTFSAEFTEPLYAVLGVWHASISLC